MSENAGEAIGTSILYYTCAYVFTICPDFNFYMCIYNITYTIYQLIEILKIGGLKPDT